jgi:hypothetical protein
MTLAWLLTKEFAAGVAFTLAAMMFWKAFRAWKKRKG